MAWGGRWVLPPKGIRTLPAPMEPSNRSVSPRRLALFRLEAISRREAGGLGGGPVVLGTETPACFTAPLVFKIHGERSGTVWSFQCMTIRGLSVTTAT